MSSKRIASLAVFPNTAALEILKDSFSRFTTIVVIAMALSPAFVSGVYAQKAALKAEVEALATQLELMEAAYWQAQEAALKDREEIQAEIAIIDDRLARAYERRNTVVEEIFLVKENLAREEAELEVALATQEGLVAGMREVVEKDSRKLSSAFPSVIEKGIASLSRINTKRPPSQVALLVEEIIGFKTQMVSMGESNELYKAELQVADEGIKQGQALRVGFVQGVFLAEDGMTGVLIRTADLKGIRYDWNFGLPSSLASSITSSLEAAENGLGQGGVQVPVDIVQAGVRTQALLQSAQGGGASQALAFFRAGGIIMYPLGVLALLAVFIVFERFLFFVRTRGREFAADGFVLAACNTDKEAAMRLLSKAGGFYKNLLFEPFFKNNFSSREEGERLLEERLSNVTRRLDARLSTLAILGTVAPLLGLLGTVSGMITLFDVITLYGTSNPKVLAGGISIALITTQAGLGIAIPILLVHHFLRQYKNKTLDRLEAMCIAILEAVAAKKNLK